MFTADKVLGSHRWPLVRLRSGATTEVVLLSPQFFALTTHWRNGTFPCCVEDCRVCELLPSRGLFYLAVLCGSRVSILELGALSASHLEQHAKFMASGLRPGNVFELSRAGDKKPVRAEYVRFVEKTANVTQLELATRVLALYKFPNPNPAEDLALYEERIRKIAKVRCDRAAELISNAGRR